MKVVGRATRARRRRQKAAEPTASLPDPVKRFTKARPKAHADLYATPWWRKARLKKLQGKPLCEGCEQRPAREVDHEVMHRGDRDLFFDYSNLRALCPECHRVKTGLERRLAVRFHDPLDDKPRIRIGKHPIS